MAMKEEKKIELKRRLQASLITPMDLKAAATKDISAAVDAPLAGAPGKWCQGQMVTGTSLS